MLGVAVEGHVISIEDNHEDVPKKANENTSNCNTVDSSLSLILSRINLTSHFKGLNNTLQENDYIIYRLDSRTAY